MSSAAVLIGALRVIKVMLHISSFVFDALLGKKKTTETPSFADTDSQEGQPSKRRGRPKKEDLADIKEVRN